MFNLKKEKLYEGKFAGAVFSAAILLYIFISSVGGLILSSAGAKQTDFIYVLISALFSVVALFIVTFTVGRLRGERLFSVVKAEKFNPVYLLFSVAVAVGVFCGFGFINDAVARLIEKLNGNVGGISLDVNTPTELVLFIILYAILPAAIEEFFFRGLIATSLRGLKNEILTAVLTGLVFAFYHANFSQLIYQFIYGFALTLLTIRSRSVLPAVLAHFLNNLAVILFTYFKVDINLYSPFLIAAGVLIVFALGVLFFAFNKKEKENKNTEGAGGFFIYASVGIALCVLIMIGSVIKV